MNHEYELKDYVKRQQQLYEEIGNLKDELKEVNCKIKELEFGLKVGDKIEYKGKIGIVREFETYCMIVSFYTKQGLPSKMNSRIYAIEKQFIKKVAQ